jgi:arsenate reductase (thioredoxin)
MDTDAMRLDRRRALQEGAARLHREFAGMFGEETIERLLADSNEQLSGARYDTFVPMLAERFARERLRAAAKIEGRRTTTAPSVMFLCVHNAGRSQMAAGWMRHLAGDRVEVASGGSAPAEAVNPAAVDAMAEVGVDITQQFPKPWTEETLGAADVIVTMGCGDACPIILGKRYLDWELGDPAGKGVEEVRPIRDDIERRVRALLADLDVDPIR